jgi:hypothetical protein
MRDFRDAKAMAHALRGALQVKAVDITHSESLELIAKAFGYDDWNILAAKIEAAVPHAPEVPAAADTAPKATLYCSFCGKSQHEVHTLVAGPTAFICDECTDLCNDIIEDKVIAGVLQADEGSDDGAHQVALERLRAKSTQDLTSFVERGKRGTERLRLELRCISQLLEMRDDAARRADVSTPSRFAFLKGMTSESLLGRQEHIARDLKRYEDVLRIATGVLDGR